MNLLLSLALVAAAAADTQLSLSIAAPQTDVLVGEPVKLAVTWKAGARPVKHVYIEDEDFLTQSLSFVVDDGSAKRTYREFPNGVVEFIAAPVDLKAGESVSRNLVLVRGSYVHDEKGRPVQALLFPTKGRYTLQAVYSRAVQPVTSNSLSFTVAEPSGVERDVFAAIRQDEAVIQANGTTEVQALTKTLVEKHPSSRYLRWTRIKLLEQRANALHNRFDPDTGEPLGSLKGADLDRFRAERHRRMATDVLDAPDWGPFEEEALAMAMAFAEAGGDNDRAAYARKLLFEKHPNSVTVREIKKAEAEEADDDNDDDAPRARPTPTPKQ